MHCVHSQVLAPLWRRFVRMAYLAVVASHTINDVST